MEQIMVKNKRRTPRQFPYLALLDDQMARLRHVERHIDDLFQQVVDGLDEQALASASERFDDLVLTFPELRLSNMCAYPAQASALLAQLDLETGPQPGYHEALLQLHQLCVTPQTVHALRAKLYNVAARVADSCPSLLPTVAVATLSLHEAARHPSAFLEMVICASAIESLICCSFDDVPVCTDVSTWLAAEPSAALIAAVGEQAAYYYAAIPGLLAFLDPDRVLFDVDRLAPEMCASVASQARHYRRDISAMVDSEYRAVLADEIRRVQQQLRQEYPAGATADIEMLAQRALDALEELPPLVNPLLQAIFVQSWVRYLSEVR